MADRYVIHNNVIHELLISETHQLHIPVSGQYNSPNDSPIDLIM